MLSALLFDAVWLFCVTAVHCMGFRSATLLSPKWTKSRLTPRPSPSYGITFRCTGADSVARRGGSLRDCTAPPLHYVRPVIVFVIRLKFVQLSPDFPAHGT